MSQDLLIVGALNHETIRSLYRHYTPGEPFYLSVCTQGGDADVWLTAVDLLGTARTGGELYTCGFGEVLSGGPLLVAMGSPGCRRAGRHTLFGMHEPYLTGVTEDPAAQACEFRMIESMKDRFYNLLAEITPHTKRFWRNRLHNQPMLYFDAQDACKMGLIDEVGAWI